jgi:hypothetical protein
MQSLPFATRHTHMKREDLDDEEEDETTVWISELERGSNWGPDRGGKT